MKVQRVRKTHDFVAAALPFHRILAKIVLGSDVIISRDIWIVLPRNSDAQIFDAI